MKSNKNILRILSLSVGLTFLSCTDDKNRTVIISNDEKGLNTEEEIFIDAAKTGTKKT